MNRNKLSQHKSAALCFSVAFGQSVGRPAGSGRAVGNLSGGGYGMEAEALSVDKASALHDEAFTVSARVKNVGDGKFPGGQMGAALLDNGGGIVEVVGTVNSFAAVRAGESYPVSIKCAATDDVAPGQYRVMIVVRQKGGGWKTAAGNAVNFAVKGAAAVTPTAAITPATVASVVAKPAAVETKTAPATIPTTTVANAAGKKGGDDTNGVDIDDNMGGGDNLSNDTTPTPASITNSAGKIIVGPLLKTTWGAGDGGKYGKPDVFNTLPDGGKDWIGCGNIAMGQIMKFHRYPTRGLIEGVDFDWDNMLDTYKNIDATEQQRKAILTLFHKIHGMFSSVGVMEKIIPLGYDKGMRQHFRSDYDDSTWAAIIRGQLDLGLPVYMWAEYGTDSKPRPNTLSHFFVIDGYDNKGKFHVNWGIGGGGDGYYYLDSLNSNGRSQEKGLNRHNYIIINIQPDKGSLGSNEMSLDSFAVGKTSIGQYELFNVSAKIRNLGVFPGGQAGTALVDNKGNIAKVIGIKKFAKLRIRGKRSYKLDAFIPEDVNPGQYTLRLVTRFEGGEWKIVTLSDKTKNVPNAINLTVTPPEPGAPGGGYGLALKAFSSDKSAAAQKEAFDVAVTIYHVGEDKLTDWQLGAALVDNGGNIVKVVGSQKRWVATEQGWIWKPTTIKCNADAIPPGKYRLRVVIKRDNEEWRVATMAIVDAPTAIDFTVR